MMLKRLIKESLSNQEVDVDVKNLNVKKNTVNVLMLVLNALMHVNVLSVRMEKLWKSGKTLNNKWREIFKN